MNEGRTKILGEQSAEYNICNKEIESNRMVGKIIYLPFGNRLPLCRCEGRQLLFCVTHGGKNRVHLL